MPGGVCAHEVSEEAMASTLNLTRCLAKTWQLSLTNTRVREEAVALYQEALQGFKQCWGPNDDHTISVAPEMGQLLLSRGCTEDDQMQGLEVWQVVHDYWAAKEGEGSEMQRSSWEPACVHSRCLKRRGHTLSVWCCRRCARWRTVRDSMANTDWPGWVGVAGCKVMLRGT